MISKTALKAKIKRSKVSLVSTFVGDEIINNFTVNNILNPFISEGEEVLILFDNEKEGWVLTSKRLILSNSLVQVLIKDMDRVDFDDIKEEKSTKRDNNKLHIHLKNSNKQELTVEDNSWFLFYDVFRWIINKNKLDLERGFHDKNK